MEGLPRLLALGLGKIEVILVDPVQYHAQLITCKKASISRMLAFYFAQITYMYTLLNYALLLLCSFGPAPCGES